MLKYKKFIVGEKAQTSKLEKQVLSLMSWVKSSENETLFTKRCSYVFKKKSVGRLQHPFDEIC